MSGQDKVTIRLWEPTERLEQDRHVQVPLHADSDSMIADMTPYPPSLACKMVAEVEMLLSTEAVVGPQFDHASTPKRLVPLVNRWESIHLAGAYYRRISSVVGIFGIKK